MKAAFLIDKQTFRCGEAAKPVLADGECLIAVRMCPSPSLTSPIESLVRPGKMAARLDKFPQQPLQVALPQDDHVVQKLATQVAHEPFHELILPWTTVS